MEAQDVRAEVQEGAPLLRRDSIAAAGSIRIDELDAPLGEADGGCGFSRMVKPRGVGPVAGEEDRGSHVSGAKLSHQLLDELRDERLAVRRVKPISARPPTPSARAVFWCKNYCPDPSL